MEKFLRPNRFGVESNTPGCDRKWLHWKKTFENFLVAVESLHPNKLNTLINFLEPEVYEFVSEITTYDIALGILESLYNKTKNEVYAQHLLATRRQQEEESLDQYLQSLKTLSKDCAFKAVSAQTNKDDCICDSYISGLQSNEIRKRLLEKTTLTLEEAHTSSRSLEDANKHSKSFQQNFNYSNTNVSAVKNIQDDDKKEEINPITDNSVAAVNTKERTRTDTKCSFVVKVVIPGISVRLEIAVATIAERKDIGLWYVNLHKTITNLTNKVLLQFYLL